MDEIDTLFTEMIQKRTEAREKINEQAEQLKQDPTKEFNLAYTEGVKQLSAKDGLGRTFGQPRRLAQAQLRSEMTKCEDAQKGVDQLIEKLIQLCKEANEETKIAKKPQDSISIKIRMIVVQIMRCIIHYATHLQGLK